MSDIVKEQMRIIEESGVDMNNICEIAMCAWDCYFVEAWNYIIDHKEDYIN
jgi:hypothetical protein